VIALHYERAELLSVQRHMVAEPVLPFYCLWVNHMTARRALLSANSRRVAKPALFRSAPDRFDKKIEAAVDEKKERTT
jgi:hypothetical protein